MADKQRTDTVFKVISGERFTPFSLAKKLGAKMLLESSSFDKGKARYSLLMAKEAFTVSQENKKIFLEKNSGRFEITANHRDILDVLMYFARQHKPFAQDFPFPAGGLGFLSYEFSRFCDSIRFKDFPDELDMPDAMFLFGHLFIVFDHFTDKLFLIGLNYNEKEINLELAIEELERKILDLDFNYLNIEVAAEARASTALSDNEENYKNGVITLKEEIRKGNLFQAVLSRRLSFETELSALDAYRNLRSANPSPYMFYLDFTRFQLFGTSPEVHVKVKNNKAILRPIAGTRRRGKTNEEDLQLEQELKNDEKEKAEHLMLVDLARNDLGRIAKPGSVKVTESMVVERYSHLMHLVSQVEADLDPKMCGIDVIRATFPAGTVSGAPKIRAIETLDALEKKPRRFYAGLVGYLEPDGGLDTCITIRSAAKIGNKMILQAGAGIVWDSTPQRELEETKEKLRALAHSIGVEV